MRMSQGGIPPPSVADVPGGRAESANLIWQKGRRSEMGYGQVSEKIRLVFSTDPVHLRNCK